MIIAYVHTHLQVSERGGGALANAHQDALAHKTAEIHHWVQLAPFS